MATWNCASSSRTDVNYYAGDGGGASGVHDGDTIVIPGTTSAWTSPITVTKQLWIHGEIAGITNDAKGRTTAATTRIQDSMTRGGGGSAPFFSIDTPLGKNVRISHIQFENGSASTRSNGAFEWNGHAVNHMVDHCVFNVTQTDRVHFWVSGAPLVLFKFCTGTIVNQWTAVQAESWKGVGLWGDNSWATDTNWGSRDFVFTEDCYLVGSGTGITDGYRGARWVIRMSEVYDAQMASHGTESSHRERGQRAVEFYGNIHHDRTFGDAGTDRDSIFLRSGIIMYHNNTMTNFYRIVDGKEYRSTDVYTPWGAVDGTGKFDNNDATIFASGKHTGGSATDVLTDGTKSWTVHQWEPNPASALQYGFGLPFYSVRNKTQGWSSFVLANDATTITTAGALAGGPGPAHTWALNDDYEIRTAYPALDQVGWGKGDLLSGANGINQDPDQSPYWPNQEHERCYVFKNSATNGDGVYLGSNAQPNVQVSRDIIIDDSAAGRPSGPSVKSGVFASRPVSPIAGDGYWSTDLGSWNDGSNSLYTGQGVLDICTTNGSWNSSKRYTPLAYPHPLYAEWQSGLYTGSNPDNTKMFPIIRMRV